MGALGTAHSGVALAAARRTGLLKGHGAHLHVDGSTSAALLALFAAVHARLRERQFEVLGRSAVRLFHGDADLVIVIRPPHRASPVVGSREPAEHLGEQVGREPSGAGGKSSGISFSASELIEVGALLGITQDFIGFLDLLELLGVTALVRVVLADKFAVGFLDVRLGRVPIEA
jgi:hypothetical protein